MQIDFGIRHFGHRPISSFGSPGLMLNAGNQILLLVIALHMVTFFRMPVSCKAGEMTPRDAFLWIEYGPVIKAKDGSVTQRFFIRMAGGAPDQPHSPSLVDLKAFYRTRPAPVPGRGSQRHPEEGREDYRKLDIGTMDGIPFLEIDTRAFSIIQILVQAEDGGVRFKAQTSCTLFGKSGRKTKGPTSPKEAFHPGKPLIRLAPAFGHYWMQTGTTYRFTYESMGESPNSAWIVDPEKSTDTPTRINRDADGLFDYTPLHDPDLDRAGPQASKEMVFLVREIEQGPQQKTEYLTSYSLNLHRSRYGHRKLGPGVALFLMAAAMVAVMVVNSRRGMPY